MRFWQNVVEILEARGKSLRSLARDVGVSAPALTNYSHGSIPSLDIAARIARALNVSLDALVWNEPGQPAPSLCPAPSEHELVKEVVHELGLPDLIRLSRLGTNWAILQVVEVLRRANPTPLSYGQLRHSLPEMADEVLQASVTALNRMGIIEGSFEDEKKLFRLVHNVPHIMARALGDHAQNISSAAKILFNEVFPALEQPVRTASLLTLTGCFRRDRAEQLAADLNDLVKERFRSSAEAEPADTDISIVFGVAYKPQSC